MMVDIDKNKIEMNLDNAKSVIKDTLNNISGSIPQIPPKPQIPKIPKFSKLKPVKKFEPKKLKLPKKYKQNVLGNI
jgi:hypothetical protein